jgi:hypothetical protein
LVELKKELQSMQPNGINIKVKDTTGQRTFEVGPLPSDATIDEVVKNLLSYTQEPTHDQEGRVIPYALRNSEGRLVGGNERLGDCVEDQSTVEFMPTINAG